MAIQLIINREWGLAKNENPNQGAFIIDELTDLVEEAVLQEFEAISRRGGVLGVAFDAVMLQPGWVRGQSKREVTIDRAVEHIDHICQLAGNCRHAGVGSDLDGGYGTEQVPADLDTIADLQRIPELLAKRGYKTADVEAVMHGNWLRFFGDVLPN